MKTVMKNMGNSPFRLFFFTLALMLPFEVAKADLVKRIYEAEMPVEAQTQEEREYVAREALRDVLIRASGRTAAGEMAKDTNLVPNPTPFIQQFRYRKFAPDEIIPAADEGAKPYTQKLWVQFNQKSLREILLKQGFPVWGETRPATLIWLVIDDQKQRTLIGNNTPHVARTLLDMAASKRGLPVRLPLLDLADQARLRVTDVWGNFEDTILDASQRYQTESVLVGRIYLSYANTWKARWTLYLAGQRQDWEADGDLQLKDAINKAIAEMGEITSLRFAQVQDNEANNTVLIKIKGITNLGLYNRAVEYLQNLNIISEVSPAEVNRDNVVFKVTSHNGRLAVAQAISLGKILLTDIAQPVDPVMTTREGLPGLHADLTYKLIP